MDRRIEHMLVAAVGFASLPLTAIAFFGSGVGYLFSLFGVAFWGGPHIEVIGYIILLILSGAGVVVSWLLAGRITQSSDVGRFIAFVVVCGWSLGFTSWLTSKVI